MHMPVFSQAVVDEIDHACRNGETQTFTASALRQNEGVDSQHGAVHIHQRASAIAGVDGCIGLNIGEGLAGVGLARERTDHPHGDRVLQTFGTSDGEDQLPHMGTLLGQELKSGQIRPVNLEQRKIGFLVLAYEVSLQNPAFAHWHGRVAHGQRQGDANALRTGNNVGVGHDVAVGVHDHSRADGVLADDQRSLGSIFLG